MSKRALNADTVKKLVDSHPERMRAIARASSSDRAHRMKLAQLYQTMLDDQVRNCQSGMFSQERKWA